MIDAKPDGEEEIEVRGLRREEEKLRADGGERRCLALSARLKRGRNMQMDAGGRYVAALGRRQPGSCALGGAGRRINNDAGVVGYLCCHGAGRQLRAEHRHPSTIA